MKIGWISVLALIVYSCAAFNDFLDINAETNPAVIFPCDIERAGFNTLLLLGIKNSSVIADIQSKQLNVYLIHQNKTLTISGATNPSNSYLLKCAPVSNESYSILTQIYPTLKDMNLFFLYLKEMRADENQLVGYKMLGDGKLVNVSSYKIEYIKERKVSIVSIKLNKKRSEFYERMIGNNLDMATFGVDPG